jgi:hypothetical protein
MNRRIVPLSIGVALMLAALGFQVGYAAAHSHSGRGSGTGPMISFGPAHALTLQAYNGYYDSHLDEYVNTDVSNKAQANRFKIKFAPILRHAVPKATSPEYFVVGRAASGQLAVFGSEPPDVAYSPLWREFIVKWKPGVKPVLLTSDNEILAKQSKGQLTVRKTRIVINSPIFRIGHK